MKKFLIALLGVGLSFTMVACGDDDKDTGNDDSGDVTLSEDEQAVETAKARLVYSVLEKDVLSSFDLFLTVTGGVSVSYTSSNEQYLKIEDGRAVVTRPDEAAVKVNLTATLTKGSASTTKIFEVNIAKSNGVNVANALNGSIGDTIDLTVGDIVVTAILKYGFYVTDNNGNYVYVTSSGNHPTDLKVGDTVQVFGSRATYGAGTPVLEMNSVEIIGTETIDLAPKKLDSVEDIKELDLTSPSSYGVYNVKGIIVSEQDGQYDILKIYSEDLSLSYTFHYHSNSIETLEKYIGKEVELNFYIHFNHSSAGVYLLFEGTEADVKITNENPTLPQPPQVLEETIADLKAGTATDVKVNVQTVSLVANVYNGAIVTDGTDMIFCYKYGGLDIFTEGEEYTITGTFSHNYSQPQLKDVSIVEKTNDTVTTNPLIAVEKTVTEIIALEASSNASYIYANITGTLSKEGSVYYLSTGDDKIKLSVNDDLDLENSIDKEISLESFVGSYHSANEIWTVFVLGLN